MTGERVPFSPTKPPISGRFPVGVEQAVLLSTDDCKESLQAHAASLACPPPPCTGPSTIAPSDALRCGAAEEASLGSDERAHASRASSRCRLSSR
eukprot:CAMPEP_0113267390 /NCGR_PEP_ID=MMETSP0008_2-20120614/20580_1 /TAXON_ID=97485 /ORGANISM="Prymnesium parvum" /LENGTH=94 /DNA_ID=CAMNT_0000116413 /DNA_START=249 /DNA_END=529 /DNA_ORIENTATION=- /assembly_acc=CAM_ASM_000153